MRIDLQTAINASKLEKVIIACIDTNTNGDVVFSRAPKASENKSADATSTNKLRFNEQRNFSAKFLFEITNPIARKARKKHAWSKFQKTCGKCKMSIYVQYTSPGTNNSAVTKIRNFLPKRRIPQKRISTTKRQVKNHRGVTKKVLFVPHKICNSTSGTVAPVWYERPKLRRTKNQNAKRIAEKPKYGIIKLRNFFRRSSRNGAFAERSKV